MQPPRWLLCRWPPAVRLRAMASGSQGCAQMLEGGQNKGSGLRPEAKGNHSPGKARRWGLTTPFSNHRTGVSKPSSLESRASACPTRKHWPFKHWCTSHIWHQSRPLWHALPLCDRITFSDNHEMKHMITSRRGGKKQKNEQLAFIKLRIYNHTGKTNLIKD